MITGTWKTVAIVGFSGGVSRDQNPAAYGGVCLLQARRNKSGQVMGRRVNSNGRHLETGAAFALDANKLANWESIAKASR
jgi:hypothetical protein